MNNIEIGKTANILNYQRLSTEDGPGIRTTVFMKGCPLHCAWCHNPESILQKQEIQWMAVRCIGCNTCIQICPENALQRNESGLLIDRQSCNLCGQCWQGCPTNALEVLGINTSLDLLIKELMKDEAFYLKSGGGVTFSGGEPTLQSSFVQEALQQLCNKNINTAIDTCGFYNQETIKKIIPFTDLVLFDLKLIDSDQHLEYTGQRNEIILQNLRQLIAIKKSKPAAFDLWIRTPLIPGITTTQDNLKGIANFLTEIGVEYITRWELCAFNNLCQDKYERLNLNWQFSGTLLMRRTELEACKQWVLEAGFPPEQVFITGASRVELKPEGEVL
ncbi:MAG: glycyl-radical enzyme activating protein [Anaerolineaceae bacterium]